MGKFDERAQIFESIVVELFVYCPGNKTVVVGERRDGYETEVGS